MKTYQEMSKEELMQEKTALEHEYAKIVEKGLALDMSRGKPSAEQLDLSMLINPEMMAAGELCNLLKFPSAVPPPTLISTSVCDGPISSTKTRELQLPAARRKAVATMVRVNAFFMSMPIFVMYSFEFVQRYFKLR